MRVRRRTVWFMTLLSLVAVISVYYLVDPAKQFNGLTIFTDDTLQQTAVSGVNASRGYERGHDTGSLLAEPFV